MKRTPTRAAATPADRAMTARELRAIVGAVKVPGTVLQELDALAQEHCGAIELLADLALRRLSSEPDAVRAVRQVLGMVQDHAMRLGDAINASAEAHGCNHVDGEAHAPAVRPTAAP